MKTWNTPELETLALDATATDFYEEGNDGGFFDLIQGEGCSMSDLFGSQCS